MSMPNRKWQGSAGGSYRFSFNGKEDDTEWGVQDYGMRIYDKSIGKFLSVDPLTSEYPWLTPYQFAANMPINSIDLDGLEQLLSITSSQQMVKIEQTGAKDNNVTLTTYNLKYWDPISDKEQYVTIIHEKAGLDNDNDGARPTTIGKFKRKEKGKIIEYEKLTSAEYPNDANYGFETAYQINGQSLNANSISYTVIVKPLMSLNVKKGGLSFVSGRTRDGRDIIVPVINGDSGDPANGLPHNGENSVCVNRQFGYAQNHNANDSPERRQQYDYWFLADKPVQKKPNMSTLEYDIQHSTQTLIFRNLIVQLQSALSSEAIGKPYIEHSHY